MCCDDALVNFHRLEATKLRDEDRARKMFSASVRQQFRQCLQACVEAMWEFDGSMGYLLSGIATNSEKFVRVIDALKAQVTASQRQIAGTALREATTALEGSAVLMENLPDPTQTEQLF